MISISIEDVLEPHHVYYYEDPFGKTKYEPNAELQRSISSIVDTVRTSEDAYVIITSREEIFKDFQGRNNKGIKKFEQKLNIKTPSYDYEKRKEMLLKRAVDVNSVWLDDEDVRNTVLKSMKDETMLSTPLNIRNFVNAVKREIDKQIILHIMKEKSVETAISFGKEIEDMLPHQSDRMVFLSFPFISDGFAIDFVKSKYEELIKELKEDLKIENPWNFNGVFDYFKEDKIEIKDRNLRFSHPSYSEAIKYIISEDRFTTRAAEILERVLLKVAESNYYDYNEAIVRIIADNFNQMPAETQKLFFQLADNSSLDYKVSAAITNNFDKLPENVRNILLRLADKEYAAGSVVSIVANNFDKLSENLKNKLLLKVAYSRYVASNFDKLPVNVQNLLFKLAESKDAAYYVAHAVSENFDKIPESIRNEIRKLGNSRENSDGTST